MDYMQRLHYTVDMEPAQSRMWSQPFLGPGPSQGSPWAQATRRIEEPEDQAAKERQLAAAAAAGKEAAEEQRLLRIPPAYTPIISNQHC